MLGPNGAGKTTTINMLCCLLKPTAGTATVMGHDVQKESLAIKEIMDISPQETAIAAHLNARENLAPICRDLRSKQRRDEEEIRRTFEINGSNQESERPGEKILRRNAAEVKPSNGSGLEPLSAISR